MGRIKNCVPISTIECTDVSTYVNWDCINWPCLLRCASVIAHHHTPKMILRSAIFSTPKSGKNHTQLDTKCTSTAHLSILRSAICSTAGDCTKTGIISTILCNNVLTRIDQVREVIYYERQTALGANFSSCLDFIWNWLHLAMQKGTDYLKPDFYSWTSFFVVAIPENICHMTSIHILKSVSKGLFFTTWCCQHFPEKGVLFHMDHTLGFCFG